MVLWNFGPIGKDRIKEGGIISVLNPVAGTVSYVLKNLIVYVLNIFFECVHPVAFHAT